MKKKPYDSKSGAELEASLAEGGDVTAKISRAERRAMLRADKLLAKRCVAGEVAAWEQLYQQCHDSLLVSIRIMLGPQSADASLVDEIGARVWYALVANDGELLSRYRPRHGARLITFLRLLARDEIVRYIRSEVRRRNREMTAVRERPRGGARDNPLPVNALADFLSMLTPHERLFCNEYLLALPTGAAEGEYTNSNVWQLSHRIRRKLLQFIGRD